MIYMSVCQTYMCVYVCKQTMVTSSILSYWVDQLYSRTIQRLLGLQFCPIYSCSRCSHAQTHTHKHIFSNTGSHLTQTGCQFVVTEACLQRTVVKRTTLYASLWRTVSQFFSEDSLVWSCLENHAAAQEADSRSHEDHGSLSLWLQQLSHTTVYGESCEIPLPLSVPVPRQITWWERKLIIVFPNASTSFLRSWDPQVCMWTL